MLKNIKTQCQQIGTECQQFGTECQQIGKECQHLIVSHRFTLLNSDRVIYVSRILNLDP